MKCLHRFDWKAALLTTTTVQPDRIGLHQGNTVVADVLTVNIGMDTWHIVSLTHWPQSIPRTHIMDWVLEDFLWNRSQDTLNYKSTLVQVMACCRQAVSYYLSKCWHGSMSLYGVTRPPLILRFSISRHTNMNNGLSWWRHQMETFSASLALCSGTSPAPVNSPHKGQWRGALMFSLIYAWINDWVNNREAGDLRRHRGHCDVNVMVAIHQKMLLKNNIHIKVPLLQSKSSFFVVSCRAQCHMINTILEMAFTLGDIADLSYHNCGYLLPTLRLIDSLDTWNKSCYGFITNTTFKHQLQIDCSTNWTQQRAYEFQCIWDKVVEGQIYNQCGIWPGL